MQPSEHSPQPDRGTSPVESRDPLMASLGVVEIVALQEPEAVLDQIRSIRARNGGQSAVNNYLERVYCDVKAIAADLPQPLANAYAEIFRTHGGTNKNHEPNFAAEARTMEAWGATNEDLRNWFASAGSGLSAHAMLNHFMDRPYEQAVPVSYPHDADDFSRCVGLIDAVPAFRERIPGLAVLSERWAAIAQNWDMLEGKFRELGPRSKEFSRLLNDTMSERINYMDALTPGSERYERAMGLIKDPQDVEQMPIVAGLELASDATRILADSGVKDFWVCAWSGGTTSVMGSGQFGEDKRLFARALSPEDFPGADAVSFRFRVGQEDKAYRALAAS